MPRSLSFGYKNGKKSGNPDHGTKLSNRSVGRLAGGADTPEKPEDIKNEALEEENIAEDKDDAEVGTLTEEAEEISNVENEIKKCPSLELIATGDKRVDELIEYVRKNVHEACEILASLGDNIEHEIKLLFVDVIARIRKWVDSTGDKLKRSMSETKCLQREIKTKLESLANCENDNEELRSKLIAVEASKVSLEESLEKLQSKSQRSKNIVKGGASQATVGQLKSVNDNIAHEETHDWKDSVENVEQSPSQRKVRDSMQDEAQPRESIDEISSGLSRVSSKIDNRMKINSERKDQESCQRIIELEKEIECLRKENERLVKERTEYENAVQRALLKGVSSLNVEALKVMRNPPACYDPCGPSSSVIESLAPCAPRATPECNTSSYLKYGDLQAKKSQVKKTCTNVNCPSAKHRKKSFAQSLLLLD